MSILITGVTGFIGSNLATRLTEGGHTVFGFVEPHLSRSDLKPLQPLLERISFFHGDLADYHSVRRAITATRPEALIHLGAYTSVRHSFEDPFPFARVNIEGTMNIAHAVLEVSPQTKIIAASTAEVYGWQQHEPISEEARLNPTSPYAVSKVAADTYLQMAVKIYGLRSIVLRCSNTYGRRGEKGFFVEYLINSMFAGQPVYIGAPGHIREYMFVDDHVSAYVKALEHGESGVFNVSPGNPISNLELAKKIAGMTGFKGKFVEGSYPPGYPMRPASLEADYIVLDSTKIRKTLGWSPSVSLDEGLRLAIGLWR